MLTFRIVRAFISLALLAGSLCPARAAAHAAPAAEETLLGQPVASVRVVEAPGHVLAENPSNLAVVPGRPLERDALRSSLRRLYATGRYADITAEAFSTPEGLRVDFLVRLNTFIGDVRFEGLQEPPSGAQALGALRLGLGERFRQADLDRGLARVDQILRENGFYAPVFNPEVRPRPGTQLVDITIRVETGSRARLGVVGVSNPTAFPSDELARTSRLKPRQPLTAARLEKGSERVRDWLFRRGYYAARVAAHAGDYDAASNTVSLTLDITTGSPVHLEVTGVKLSSGRVRQLVPIFQEASVDEDLLAEGRRNIRDYFERRGYIDCDVQYSSNVDPANGMRQITYAVTLGPRRRLAAIEFTGNKYFDDDLLRSRLTIQPAEFLRPAVFSRRLLQQNEDSLRSLYASNGFAAAKFQTETVENYRGRSDELLVRFHIEEGGQTRVESLEITGNSAISTPELLAVTGSTAGQPFSDADVASDRDNILALYLNQGLPETRFEFRTAPGSKPGTVKLAYQISEGPRITVAGVLVDGNEYTRLATIRSRIRLKPGEPLREGDLILTQRELYSLGVFSRVAVAPENPQGDETEKTMLVNVQEGKRFTVGYGAGFEVLPVGSSTNPTASTLEFSPRGIVEFTWNDLFGRAQTFQIRLRASTLQDRALAEFSTPRFLDQRNLNLQIIAFTDKTLDISTFNSTRYEGTLQLEHRISTLTTFLYRYTFRHVLTSDLKVAPQEVPLFSQPTKVSGPSVAWVRDLRDNAADPSRGRFYTVDVSLFSRDVGSTANFIRILMQNSSFTPLGHHLTFARSTRFGVETPYGGSLSTEIPLPERFFAGGGTSLRGFGLNDAGPRDTTTGFPIGGLALLTSNQELRFPLRLPYTTAAVSGALFYDAGNVYSSVEKISFRTTPPPNDLNWLSHSVGFGVHYPTPVGPIRLDLGYLLNSPQFTLPASPTGLARQHQFQFFLTFGSPF
ncbi:MAG TPA: POTRA domain-containing protein [Candidatus Acidoferrales bacterium]|nr:POTRA domain-containing protein [Candidatus Acidoferrales bacterium]